MIAEQDAEKDRQRRSRIAQRLNVRPRVRFASSLAAVLLDGLFAHPAWQPARSAIGISGGEYPMDVDASSRWLVLIGCVSAGLGVAAGAFGAHMLKDMLEPPMLAVYDTATRYQMYHAFGMVLSGFVVRFGRDAGAAKAGWLFLAGMVLFSGSLYGVSLSGVRWLGAVTPIGGALFIVGWSVLAWRAWRGTEY
jgi:uncharacterized membrane protein YgdD (TMEM256/DUF423 family)